MYDPDVVEQIKQGSVGVIPTDTVYGLVCSASNEAAVSRLYALKERHMKPGTVVAASIDQLVALGIPRRYLVAVEQYWPASISVVIPLGLKLSYLHQGKGSLAVRIPGDDSFRALLNATGPLLTSSANHPGKTTAATLEEARRYFAGRVDFYVDGGDLSGKKPSTIIRVVDDAIEVLRHGSVEVHESGEIEDRAQ